MEHEQESVTEPDADKIGGSGAHSCDHMVPLKVFVCHGQPTFLFTMIMHRIQDFMRELFLARIADEQRYQEQRASFRRKFFTEDCRYESHAGTLDRLRSETVVSVENSESQAQVVTEQTTHFAGEPKRIRLRYHLGSFGGDWMIKCVETACFVCNANGGADCPGCKGKQWLTSQELKD